MPVKAVKQINGIQIIKIFSDLIWSQFPKGKYGWVEYSINPDNIPEEILNLKLNAPEVKKNAVADDISGSLPEEIKSDMPLPGIKESIIPIVIKTDQKAKGKPGRKPKAK